MRRLISALTAAVAAITLAACAGNRGDFYGVDGKEVFAGNSAYRDITLRAQRSVGIRLLRQPFSWARIETRAGSYDFRSYDAYVGKLATYGIRVLPIIIEAPAFRANCTRCPPRRYADLGDFTAVLIRRYGPNGSFWRLNPRIPKVPIRSWQLWNEPHLRSFWPTGPNAAQYVQLIKASRPAIKAADRGAEIVTAGISESSLEGAIPMLTFIRGMYQAGVRGYIDALAVHPYKTYPTQVLSLVQQVRDIMFANRDGSPIWVTEFGWASAGRSSPFTTTEGGQAARVSEVLNGFRDRHRTLGLRGVVYYNWKDGFDFLNSWQVNSGLIRRDNSAKPALTAYKNVAVRPLP